MRKKIIFTAIAILLFTIPAISSYFTSRLYPDGVNDIETTQISPPNYTENADFDVYWDWTDYNQQGLVATAYSRVLLGEEQVYILYSDCEDGNVWLSLDNVHAFDGYNNTVLHHILSHYDDGGNDTGSMKLKTVYE